MCVNLIYLFVCKFLLSLVVKFVCMHLIYSLDRYSLKFLTG